MNLNKEYIHIIIGSNYKNDYDILKGKVVDKISLATDRNNYDMNELIITFTDKTYVAFEIFDDSDDHESERRPILENSCVIPPQCYNTGNYDCHISVVDGELRFDPLIENRIKVGLWNLTMEEAQKVIEDDKHRREEYEYKNYLRLKEKFEGREDEFKDLVKK
jgi:hypothetical protein